MPKIEKQITTTRLQTQVKISNGESNSVLSRIREVTSNKANRIKIALYGNPKTGKTRLASTFPKPLLIIGTEDGTASIAGTKGVQFLQLETCDEIYEVMEECRKGRWKTVVLDNGTKLRDMRIAELWKSEGGAIPEKKPFLYADKKWKQVWVQCSNDMKDFLTPLLDLPRQIECNVVIIAQEQDFTKEGASNDSSILRPVIGSALGESVCRFVHAECDYICNTFIREEEKTEYQEVTVGNKTERVPIRVKGGKKEFCLRVGPHEIYWTGFRQQIDAGDLPDSIVNPSYEKIVNLITGKVKLTDK